MVKNTERRKKIDAFIEGNNGFTLIEAVSVVAILSILAGVSIPAIGKWVKLNKVSEVKALASAAALECLQGIREGNDPSKQTVPESIISNDKLSQAGYQIDNNKNKCSEFNISPIDENEKEDFQEYSLCNTNLI